MTQLHIVDDFFTQDQILDIYKNSFLSENLEEDSTGKYSWDEIKIFQPIIHYAAKFFDMSDCFLYEVWQQKNSRPSGWHHDKDETLFSRGEESDTHFLGGGEQSHSMNPSSLEEMSGNYKYGQRRMDSFCSD